MADGIVARVDEVPQVNPAAASSNCDDFGQSGAIVSLGNNLFDNADCSPVASDLVTALDEIGLGPLAANPLLSFDPPGAPQTEAITPDSPAVGGAAASASPSVDERGSNASVAGYTLIDRVSPCDIGAYELNADLSTGGSASPDPSAVGTPTTFTFTVPDGGPDAGTGATFTVPIPGNASLQSDSSTVGTCTGTRPSPARSARSATRPSSPGSRRPHSSPAARRSRSPSYPPVARR